MSEAAIRRLLPLAIVAAVLVAFAPAFEAEFLHFDDDRNITENPHFRGLGGEQLEWMLTTCWMGPYQPLAWLSLAVDYVLFGLDPAAFHATNVVLHALGALALYALALRVLAFAVPGASPNRLALGAAAAALVFAVHPLRVESVVWVTERRDVLSGVFAILAAWAWARASPALESERLGKARAVLAATGAAAALALFWWSVDRSQPTRLHLQGPGWAGLALGFAALAASSAASSRSGWYHLALALTFLALLSKGLAVVLPAALCVLDVWPIGRRLSARLLLEKLPFFALSAAFSVLAVWGQASQVGTVVTWEDHGPLERLLQACYGLAYYPARTLVPLGLSPIYELPASIRILDAKFAAPLFAVVALTAGLVLLRRRLPGALAAWIAFDALASPVLGLLQRGPQLVADRYSYLACLPLALLAGGALAGARRPGRALACASIWIALVLPATWRYARAWQSSSALWEHAVAVEPKSPMSLMSLAVARAREAAAEPDPARVRALLDEADEHLSRARELSDDPRILGNLGRVRGQRAALEPERQGELLQESVELARQALAAASEQGVLLPEYHLALGIALGTAGQLEQALGHLEQAAGAAPDDFEARLALGSALAALGRPAEAATHLEIAVRLAPESVQAWRRLAEAREATGRRAEAERAWQRVLELAPEHARARERLAALRGEAAAGK